MEYKHITKAIQEAKTFINQRNKGVIKSLKTRSAKLNSALLEGVDWNRIITIAGLCLSGDTKVRIRRGKRVSGRNYTLKEVYMKYHSLPGKKSNWNSDIETEILSYDYGRETFFYNKVYNVVYSGKKDVYMIKTKSGKVIKTSKDHKFLTSMTSDEFKKLSELRVGDTIITRSKNKTKKKIFKYRREFSGSFKYYPNARKKIVNGCTYWNCLEQRVVWDAHLNNLSVQEFLDICKNPNNLQFSPSYMEIHHKDGDTLNNSIDNLELLTKQQHALEHLKMGQNNVYIPTEETIENISYVGIEDTYDVMCYEPFNNFIANQFIVHNSGSGKSTFLEQLKDDFIQLNPDANFEILAFEFEMLVQDQVAKRIAANTGKSIKQIYSSDSPLSEEDIEKSFKSIEYLEDKPIFYVEEIGSVKQIKETISDFIIERELRERNKDLIVTLDHVLLTGGAEGEVEKSVVDTLMKATVKIKKQIHSKLGINVIFIYLAQLNRDIESLDRTSKPQYHYPDKNDLFAASSTYYCSDYVMVLHKPADVRGITMGYGPPRGEFNKGLPLWHPETGDPMIYLHIIKERFGDKAIIPFINKMKFATIEETNIT